MSSNLCAAKDWGSCLPFELVEEILSRTQIEDLLRAKSISKEWYGLVKDTRFIYKHLDLSLETNKKRFIRIYQDKVQIMNPVTQDLVSLPIPAEFFAGSPKRNRISRFIHCGGLLLCCGGDGRHKARVGVWNPILSSKVKWIEPLTCYEFLDEYCFGYDNEMNFKIMRFYPLGKEYEIYDLKSKQWRVFPATIDWKRLTVRPCENVSMKGNMYWIAKTNEKSEIFIQSFDFSKESFKPICSSIPVEVRRVFTRISYENFRCRTLDAIVLSGFGGDKLSLLHQHHVGDSITKMEVWVTNKLSDGGVVVSWSKYFSVTHPELPILPLRHISFGDPTYFIHKTNGIMLWCDNVVKEEDDEDDEDVQEASVSYYEICDGEIKKQVETGPLYSGTRSNCLCGHVYVPSLVPVPE